VDLPTGLAPMGIAAFSLPELTEAAASTSAAGRALLDQLDAALADPGAFRLSDLPLSRALLEEMHAVTCEFFELPTEEKVRYRYVEDQYVGWCGGELLSEYGSRDHKEMFHIGPRVAPSLPAHDRAGKVAGRGAISASEARASCRLWPQSPERFVAVWHDYYRAMQEVAAAFGSVLATMLGIGDEIWFEAMQHNWADLAANFYPPVDAADGPAAPVYNAAHRDLTVFTILHQDQSRAGGLSVQTVDGSWHAAEPIPSTYIVNAGELLTYLSGGRWRAAPHQVTVLPSSGPGAQPRISVPFFYRPSDERVVRSFVDPDATPIAVGAWVLDRKRRSSS
jgi:isopenicillin N synthase-like dioxygenase